MKVRFSRCRSLQVENKSVHDIPGSGGSWVQIRAEWPRYRYFEICAGAWSAAAAAGAGVPGAWSDEMQTGGSFPFWFKKHFLKELPGRENKSVLIISDIGKSLHRFVLAIGNPFLCGLKVARIEYSPAALQLHQDIKACRPSFREK